jgi:hypothetical protein
MLRFSGGTKRLGPAISCPSNSRRPASGFSIPAAMRSSVVLPQPEGPRRQAISPGCSFRLTSATAAVRRSASKRGRIPAGQQRWHPPCRVGPQRRIALFSVRCSRKSSLRGVYNSSCHDGNAATLGGSASCRGKADPVAALALGAVERLVGPLEQIARPSSTAEQARTPSDTVTLRWQPGATRKGFEATSLRMRSPTRSAVWRSVPDGRPRRIPRPPSGRRDRYCGSRRGFPPSPAARGHPRHGRRYRSPT